MAGPRASRRSPLAFICTASRWNQRSNALSQSSNAETKAVIASGSVLDMGSLQSSAHHGLVGRIPSADHNLVAEPPCDADHVAAGIDLRKCPTRGFDPNG